MRSPDARDCFFVARHPKRVKLQLNCDDTAQYRFTKINISQGLWPEYFVDIDIVKPVDMTVLKENLDETFLTLERYRNYSAQEYYEPEYMRALRYSQVASKDIPPSTVFQTQFFKGWPIALIGSYSNRPCLTVKFPTKWNCRKVLKVTLDVDYSFNGIPYQEHFEETVYGSSSQRIDFTSQVAIGTGTTYYWCVVVPDDYIFTGFKPTVAYQIWGPVTLYSRGYVGALVPFVKIYMQDNGGFPISESTLHNHHVDFSGVLESFDHKISLDTIEINSCSLSGESYYELYEVDGDGFGALSCFYAIPDLMLDQFRPKVENVKMYQMDMNKINTNGQNWVTANNTNLLDDFIDASVFLDSVEW